MEGKSVTIRDVAREAGVSVATVSRSLSGCYPVSDKLRARIDAAVAKLDFHPNAIARTLKTNTTSIIGFLVSDISQSFFTTILKGVENAVKPHNYNIISCSTDGNQETEKSYLRILLEKKVDGIIINTTNMNDSFIVKISRKIPIVLSYRKIDAPEFVGDFVGGDDFSGIMELTKYLISLGHRKIGVINGKLHVSTGRERHAGFCAAMRTAGIEVGEDYPYATNLGFIQPDGYEGARLLMGRKDRPTALVCTNNDLALGALSYLYKHRISVPDEVSLVVFGDIENRELLYVHPTVAMMNLTTVGNKTGELIMERIKHGNQLNNREVRYLTTIIHGNSAKAIS